MTALEAYLAPLAECFTPDVARRIIDFRPDSQTEQRLEYFRNRANEGILTDSERSEYEQVVGAIDFVGFLKALARAALQSIRS
jgi:hypothetical protein